MVRRLLAAVTLSLVASSPAWALFHLAHISELNAQAGGQQYLEVEMEAGLQRFVTNSILGAWGCDGDHLGDLLVVPGDVANGGSGVRWIMATASPIGGITPDFSTATAGMPTDCGQVCWGAPGVSVPDPGTWDHTDPEQYVDCVAYGGYTGPTKAASGTPTMLPPGDGTLALVRVANTDDNATDFALDCPSPENNAAEVGSFGPCGATTTTTTPSGGTTTTTLPGGGSSDLVSAQKLILRTKEGRPEKSALLLLARKDGALTLGRGAGTSDDPTQAGGRLIVASGSAAGAFVGVYPLDAGGWTAKTKRGSVVGYVFKGGGAIKLVKLIAGKVLKVKGKGSQLTHDLTNDPNPVVIALELGEHAHCFQLGGKTKHKAGKLYRATRAPAPASSAACEALR